MPQGLEILDDNNEGPAVFDSIMKKIYHQVI